MATSLHRVPRSRPIEAGCFPRCFSGSSGFAGFAAAALRISPVFPSILGLAALSLAILFTAIPGTAPTAVLHGGGPGLSIVPVISFAEPNDGEIMPGLSSLHFYCFHPQAHKVVVSFNGHILGTSQVTGGEAWVQIDSSMLPNGTAPLDAVLLNASNQILGSATRAYEVAHPILTVEEVIGVAETVDSVALSVRGEAGAEIFVLLASTDLEPSHHAQYGLDLAIDVDTTFPVALGGFPGGYGGEPLCLDPLSSESLGGSDVIHLTALTYRGGVWRVSNLVTLQLQD